MEPLDGNNADTGALLDNLLADPSKYVTLPIQHDKIWQQYQQSIDQFWTFSEITIDDKKGLNTLSEEQRQFINNILVFMYLTHHTVLNKELFMDLMELIDIKEASYYLGSQADATKTHEIMYSILLDDNLAKEERDRITSNLARKPEVRALIKWFMQNFNSNDQSLPKRIFIFVILQGVLFEVVFVLLSWIAKRFPSAKMPGLFSSNSRIWRDERLNLNFSIMLFDYLDESLDQEKAVQLIKEAVPLIRAILTQSIPTSQIGMEPELINDFVQYSADKVLTDLHIPKLYFSECPFDWALEPLTGESKKKQVSELKPTEVEPSDFFDDNDF